MRQERLKDDELLDILRIMSPGTPLREGLENILKARTGALIVIGDSQEVMNNVDGGFFINKVYSPAHLYELAKMDGAIIISKDLKTILYANALLIPDSSIPTDETGTRHKSAQRFAKETGEIVISISQRRNIITLYKGSRKYILRETSTILTRANQALQTLEKYKAVLDSAMNNLSVLEFEDIVTLDDVAFVIQRTEMVMRIVSEIDRYICELGNEGRLISMQLEELLSNIEEDGLLVIDDYFIPYENKTAEDVQRQVRFFSYDELMDLTAICRALGYYGGVSCLDVSVSPRGYRIMSKIPRIPMGIMKNLVSSFSNLQGVLKASIEALDSVEGIGEVRARMIKEGLRRVRDQLLMDNRRI
ncbi:MAG: DNA integrity scanning diadenylate cyclase DisA [Clostridia bacterium]|nr:DNA integrity scanning diadenylate cyclase DisA [Clostridia bacterium]